MTVVEFLRTTVFLPLPLNESGPAVRSDSLLERRGFELPVSTA